MLNDTTPLKVCKDEENNKLFNEYIARSRPDGVSDERLQEIVNHALDIVADRYYDDCHDSVSYTHLTLPTSPKV